MIKYVFVKNNKGKTRLSRWWIPVGDNEREAIESKVEKLINCRTSSSFPYVIINGADELVIRKYANLHFVVGVDSNENKLVICEFIQRLVEILDKLFNNNVCELDLVYNFNKVYQVLDEVILDGNLSECDSVEVLTQLKALSKS